MVVKRLFVSHKFWFTLSKSLTMKVERCQRTYYATAIYHPGGSLSRPLAFEPFLSRADSLISKRHFPQRFAPNPIWDSIADSASLAARLFSILCTLVTGQTKDVFRYWKEHLILTNDYSMNGRCTQYLWNRKRPGSFLLDSSHQNYLFALGCNR